MIARTLSLCTLLLTSQPNFSNIEDNIVNQEVKSHREFKSMYGDYSLGVHPNDYSWTWAVDYGFSPGEEPSIQGKDWFFKGNNESQIGIFRIEWWEKTKSLNYMFDSLNRGYEVLTQLSASLQGMLAEKEYESRTKKINIDDVKGLMRECKFNMKLKDIKIVYKSYLLVFQEKYRTYSMTITYMEEPKLKGLEKEHKKFLEDSERLWEDALENFHCFNTHPDSVKKLW